MTFTRTPFLILFVVVYSLWLLCRFAGARQYAARLFVLLVGSLVFYGHDHWPLVFLIAAYAGVDWTVGRVIERAQQPRIALMLGVTFNLLVLSYWKYTPMVLRTLAALVPAITSASPSSSQEGWEIPFGISFYAFTGIAYMVDVYRRQSSAETSPVRLLLYLSFFPHLMAGPILRASEFLVHLRPGRLPDRPEAPREAALLLARGYFKKMVLADRIGLAIDPFFLHVGDVTTAGVWALPYVYLYAFQIYFDFSGYTDIARGLALLFGFRWPENFRLPYLAGSVREFWGRWHITLSLFLRDYVYIPLGGNRRGRIRSHVNVMLTMLLGGLWHGGSWSFVMWGGLHGAYLIVHRLWSASRLRSVMQGKTGVVGRSWELACVAVTFHSVCLAWCFFRLTALAESLECLRKCAIFDADKLLVGGVNDPSLGVLLGVYGAMALAVHWYARRDSMSVKAHTISGPLVHGFTWGFSVTLLLLAFLLAPVGDTPPFIYFQF